MAFLKRSRQRDVVSFGRNHRPAPVRLLVGELAGSRDGLVVVADEFPPV